MQLWYWYEIISVFLRLKLYAISLPFRSLKWGYHMLPSCCSRNWWQWTLHLGWWLFETVLVCCVVHKVHGRCGRNDSVFITVNWYLHQTNISYRRILLLSYLPEYSATPFQVAWLKVCVFNIQFQWSKDKNVSVKLPSSIIFLCVIFRDIVLEGALHSGFTSKTVCF